MPSRRRFLYLLPLFIFGLSSCQRLPDLAAERGLLPKSPEPVSLSGPWSFFPNQLCSGADCVGEPVAEAPLLWRGGEDSLPGTGFGTYVLRLGLPDAWRAGPLGLMLFNVGTAYRVFADGVPYGGMGTVGTTPAETVPVEQPRYYQFQKKGEELVIAVQVSNFVHPRGGLRVAPVIAPAAALLSFRDGNMVRNILLLGVILGMAFYHLALFLSRRDDLPALLFGIFCIVYATRMLFTSEVLVRLWFPELTFRVQIVIEYIAFVMPGPVFALFLAVTYPYRGVRYPVAVVFGLCSLASLFILIVEPIVFAQYLSLFQITVLLNVVVCLMIWGVALKKRQPGALASLLGGVTASAAAVNDILFFQRISPVGPIFHYGLLVFIMSQSYLLTRLFAVAYESAQRLSVSLKRTNSALSRFVPTQFLKFLQKQDITEIHLGDQVQERMSVMFTDIRQFTALSEQMTPEENFNFLNSYLKRMAPVVNRRGGFIDKFIGDAVMALFPGAPDEALRAGIEMQQELRVYNYHRAQIGYDPISIGIGLHTGDIMLGIIGHEGRMEGTVISDTVNTASRIEGLTRRYGAALIVSQTFLDSLQDPGIFERRRLGQVRVKGKKESFAIYQILNGATDDVRMLYLKTRDRFHEAVDLAYSEQFSEATRIFNEVLEVNPMDGASRFYLERIESHQKMRAS